MGQNEYPVKTYRKSLISVITNQDYITKFWGKYRPKKKQTLWFPRLFLYISQS